MLLCVISIKAQTFTLQGKVTDSNMSPVELATVSAVSYTHLTLPTT